MLYFCLFILLFCGVIGHYSRKYANPYTLTFLFGKKGSGKSCYMVKLMLQHLKKGWIVYTDMPDVLIPGVRFIDSRDLSTFRPAEHSVVFLDEVGISMDNRNYKSFPPGLRDFFKYIRKMKCKVYMNSQAFDVDKKVRDTTDAMGLLVSLFGCISLYRPIVRSVVLVESTAQADSRIADNLKFRSIFSWRLTWMPRYFPYFNSRSMPARDEVPYRLADPDIEYPADLSFQLKEVVLDVLRPAKGWFGRLRH